MKTFYSMILAVKGRNYLAIKLTGLVIASFFLLTACSQEARYERFSGATMGTRYHITAQIPSKVSYDALEKAIKQRLVEVNHSMSTWQPDSLISQFNQAKVGDNITVDQDFINVLAVSRKVYQASGGAFNPAVGKLVNLWGFGPRLSVEHIDQLPSETEIKADLNSIDLSKVTNDGLSVHKGIDTYLDFSGVAKGYGVDQIALVLEKNGITNYMVEIGGEISTKGLNPKNEKWRIGIESPDNKTERAMLAIEVGDRGIATSGDYRNFFNENGKHYSHIIDPRTGAPTTSRLASVSVITDSVALSDAWATALTVAGEKEALQLADKNGLAVYLISHDGKNFKTSHNALMQQYLN